MRVSVSGVLFSVGVCVCDLLIFLHTGAAARAGAGGVQADHHGHAARVHRARRGQEPGNAQPERIADTPKGGGARCFGLR